MMPGPLQILLIIVLVLLLFGAGRIPRVMEDIGKGIKGFKKGLHDDDQKQALADDSVIEGENESEKPKE